MRVPAGVLDCDAPPVTAGDAGTDGVETGLPDTDENTDAEAEDVEVGDPVANADGEIDRLGTACRTATLRAVMVALNTPASLASQE